MNRDHVFNKEFLCYSFTEWHRNVPAGFRLPLWIAYEYENPLEVLLVDDSAVKVNRGDD